MSGSIWRAAKHFLKRCCHEGCSNKGDRFELDGGEVHWICLDHAKDEGFCPGCRQFWGGVESFEFSIDGLCDNCRYDPDYSEDDYGLERYSELLNEVGDKEFVRKIREGDWSVVSSEHIDEKDIPF